MSSAPPAKEAQAEAAGALEVLRRFAGDSDFYRAAIEGLATDMSAFEYLERLARILEQFAAGRSGGLLSAVSFEVAARVEAATDLMEQVKQLLSDGAVHVAAPIVLAGASLEELLRSMWHHAGSPELSGKPGINSYAPALKNAHVIDKQELRTSLRGRVCGTMQRMGTFKSSTFSAPKSWRKASTFSCSDTGLGRETSARDPGAVRRPQRHRRLLRTP